MLHHSSSLLYNTKKNSRWWFFDCCMLITHSYYCCCKSHTYFTWLLNEKKIAVKICFKRHLARVIILRLFLTLGFKENFNLWISLYCNASVAVMQVVVNPYRYPVHLTSAWAVLSYEFLSHCCNRLPPFMTISCTIFHSEEELSRGCIICRKWSAWLLCKAFYESQLLLLYNCFLENCLAISDSAAVK